MPPSLHALLHGELKRHFGDAVPEQLQPLIASLDGALVQHDRDRDVVERSLQLSTAELTMMNNEMALAVEELQIDQRELERRIAERTLQLTAAHEQLRQAQKMEAIGRLAGGIAHDFNNLLTVIFGSVASLPQASTDDERTAVTEIRRAAESATSLTKQLLAFSRRQAMVPTEIDVNELVLSTNLLLHRLMGDHIELVTDLQPTGCTVRADLSQLQRVLLNLGANARDAMPRGGRLTISTSTRVIEGVDPSREPAPGRYVVLRVADTGTGMTAEVKAQIFEPFFTTKSLTEGTGLGLATVYGIVKQSGGYIDVVSEPDRGATFEVLLPQIEVVELAPTAPPPALPAGSGCILVVEDRDPVRRVICHHLTRAGYEVLEASNGLLGLDVALSTPHLDLVLTDVVMPQLNGRGLVSKLEKLRPELKVLYMTGYIGDTEILRELSEVSDEASPSLLQKPFAPEALLRAVSTVLEHPHAS